MKPTALITGGSQGIGRAIARKLLLDGWNIAILDISEPEEALSEDALFIAGDVANEDNVRSAVNLTAATFQGLHALVNNAGIGISSPIESLTLDDWNKVISTNLTGAFLCTKYAAPHLRKSRGSIVNIASTRATQSEPNTEAYSASKGGLLALTHATAISLGPDIRVNCISPGWIDNRENAATLQSETDKAQHPCGRVGTPNDIADMTAYLLSESAGFITGQEFVADGGMTKKMIYSE